MVTPAMLARSAEVATNVLKAGQETNPITPEQQALSSVTAEDLKATRAQFYQNMSAIQMTPENLAFLKENTIQAANALGLQIEPAVIEESLQQGRIEDLDSSLYNAAKGKYEEDVQKALLEVWQDPTIPAALKSSQIAEMDSAFTFPYKAEDMYLLRADAAAKGIQDEALAESLAYREASDSKALQEYTRRVEAINTALVYLRQKSAERSWGNTSYEVISSAVPGVDQWSTLNLQGIIEEVTKGREMKGGLTKLVNAFRVGATRQEIGDIVLNSLTPKEFDQFMDMFMNTKFGTGGAALTSKEGSRYTLRGIDVLEGILRLGDTEATLLSAFSALDVLGAGSAVEAVKDTGKTITRAPKTLLAGLKGTEALKAVKRKDLIKDATKIITNDKLPLKTKKARLTKLVAENKKLFSADEIKNINEQIFKTGPSIDVDFTPLAKTPQDVKALKETGLVGAINKGDSFSVFNILGSRGAAAKRIFNKFIQKKVDAGVSLKDDEAFATMASAVAGAPRNTTPYLKEGLTLDEIRPAFYTKEELASRGFAPAKISTYSPETAQALEKTAKVQHAAFESFLKDMPVDIKVSEFATEEGTQGLRTQMLFGIGPKGDQPIPESVVKALESLRGADTDISNTVLDVVKDPQGMYWLKADGYISAERLWSPLKYKGDSLAADAKAFFFSHEINLPAEVIAHNRFAASQRAGAISKTKIMMNKAVKGATKQQKRLASAILEDEWNSRALLDKDNLYRRANYDEKVVDIVQTTHEVNKIQGSLVNDYLYDARRAAGYLDVDLSNTNPRLMNLVAAADDDVDFFSDLITAKKVEPEQIASINVDFILDLTAEVDNANNTAKFLLKPGELAKVPEGAEVYKLLQPTFIGKDKVAHIIVKKGTQVKALNPQQIGETALAGWGYSAKYFARFPRFRGVDSAGRKVQDYMKAVVYDNSLKGIKQQVAGLKEITQVYNGVMSGMIDPSFADDAIAAIGVKRGMTGFNSVASFENFLEAHGLTDLPDRIDDLEWFHNEARISVIPEVDKGDAFRMFDNGGAQRFSRGQYNLKNTRNSLMKSDLVSLEDFMYSQARRIGRMVGTAPYADIVSNRWFAAFRETLDLDKVMRQGASPLEVMRNFESYASETTKANPLSLYAAAKRNADSVLRAIDEQTTDLTFKRKNYRWMKKLADSDKPLANDLYDLFSAKDVGKRVEGFLYNIAFVGNISQFIIQAASAAPIMIMNPKHGAKGLAAYIPLRYAMYALKRDGDLRAIGEVLENLPANAALRTKSSLGAWSKLDLEIMARQALNNGFESLKLSDIRGANIYENPFSKTGWFTKTAGAFRTPFDEGNMAARLMAFATATSQHMDDTKKAVRMFTDEDWAQVISKTDVYSGGLSTANKRAFLELPVIRQLTAMESYGVLNIERILGPTIFVNSKTLKLAPEQQFKQSLLKRAKYLAGLYAIYGNKAFLPDAEAEQLALWMEDKTGGVIQADWVSGGPAEWMLSYLLGYDVSVGRLSSPIAGSLYLELPMALLNAEDTTIDEISSYHLGVLGSGLGATMRIMDILSDPETADPGFVGLSAGEKAKYIGQELLRIVPGFRNIEKVWIAKQYNMYINRNGYDVNPADRERSNLFEKALVEAAFGLVPEEESGLGRYARYMYEQDLTKERAEDTKHLSNLLASWWSAQAEGNNKRSEELGRQYQQISTITLDKYNDLEKGQIQMEIYRRAADKFTPEKLKSIYLQGYSKAVERQRKERIYNVKENN